MGIADAGATLSDPITALLQQAGFDPFAFVAAIGMSIAGTALLACIVDAVFPKESR